MLDGDRVLLERSAKLEGFGHSLVVCDFLYTSADTWLEASEKANISPLALAGSQPFGAQLAFSWRCDINRRTCILRAGMILWRRDQGSCEGTSHDREHSLPSLNMGGSHQTSGKITDYCFEFI